MPPEEHADYGRAGFSYFYFVSEKIRVLISEWPKQNIIHLFNFTLIVSFPKLHNLILYKLDNVRFIQVCRIFQTIFVGIKKNICNSA